MTHSIQNHGKLRDVGIETIAALLAACARQKYRESPLLDSLAARLTVLAREGEFNTWINPDLLLISLRSLAALGGVRNAGAKLLLNQLVDNPLRLRRLRPHQITDLLELLSSMQYRRPRYLEPLCRRLVAQLAGDLPPKRP